MKHLLCALGFHRYRPQNNSMFTHIGGNLFRVEDTCTRCGQKIRLFVRIPMPRGENEVGEK